MEGYDSPEEDAPAAVAAAGAAGTPEPVYADVYEFVDDFVLPRFRRNPKHFLWAENWYDYPEAVDRLTALWFAWEWNHHVELAGMAGMAAFWKDIFDPLIAVITSAEGPFWRLAEGKYRRGDAGGIPPVFDSGTLPLNGASDI